jgi:hypothetical protein
VWNTFFHHHWITQSSLSKDEHLTNRPDIFRKNILKGLMPENAFV